MTRSLRTFAGAFFAVLTLATGMVLAQGQPGSAKVKTRVVAPADTDAPRRPAAGAPNTTRQASDSRAQPPAPLKLTPEEVRRQAELRRQLDAILRNWEISSAEIKTLDGKHIRSRSNSVFATDARADGEFHFEAPDKGRIDLKGTTPKAGAVSSKKTTEGQNYSLTADRDEKWICDGEKILMIDDVEKQFESIELPKEMRGVNIIESPLPFLFGMKAAAAKERFDMELMHYDADKHFARIKAVPLQTKDAQNFIRAEIVLDTQRYLPTFVSLVDPAGTITTQYIFVEVSKNNEGIKRKWIDLVGGDPFKPNLKGYKPVQVPVDKIVPVGGKSTSPAFPLQQGSGASRPANGAVVPRNGMPSGATANGQRPTTK